MYLLGHNAYLTQIKSPAVTADPGKGIAGSSGTTRWTGFAQAYVDEDIARSIRQGQEVLVTAKTIIDLPSNMPVLPNVDDVISIQRVAVLTRVSAASEDAPVTETFNVRVIDGGLIMLGKLRLLASRA